jgi:hypothetical protein
MDTEKKDIKQFISNVVDRNYSQANNSLQKMIENKLKNKIKACLEPKN